MRLCRPPHSMHHRRPAQPRDSRDGRMGDRSETGTADPQHSPRRSSVRSRGTDATLAPARSADRRLLSHRWRPAPITECVGYRARRDTRSPSMSSPSMASSPRPSGTEWPVLAPCSSIPKALRSALGQRVSRTVAGSGLYSVADGRDTAGPPRRETNSACGPGGPPSHTGCLFTCPLRPVAVAPAERPARPGRPLRGGVDHRVLTGSRWSRPLERASSVCCRLRRVVKPRAVEASSAKAVVLPAGWSWAVM
jgi:hypothetical protein